MSVEYDGYNVSLRQGFVIDLCKSQCCQLALLLAGCSSPSPHIGSAHLPEAESWGLKSGWTPDPDLSRLI